MKPHTAATASTASTVTTTIDTDARSSTNLVVSHLSRYVNDEALKSAFAPFGCIVASKVMYDIHSGVSKGMGFVRFATHEEAQAALTAMHHTVLRKSKIAVRWAKEKHDEAPTGAARREMRELFIRNVPLDVVAEDVAVLASRYGTVLHAWLCPDTHANPVDPRRIAFVTFGEDGAAERALSGLHRRRPFPSCGNVSLLCKLKENYQHEPELSGAGWLSTFGTPRSMESAFSAVEASLPHHVPGWQPTFLVLRGADSPTAMRACRTKYRHDPYSFAGRHAY